MDYEITPSTDGKFIAIKIKGDITRQDAMRVNLEAHALGRQLQVRRYLVDVTEARHSGSAVDDYEFANQDMQQTEGIDQCARVATLVSRGDHSHDFMETAARNAGLDVTLFTDPEQAKRFLLNDEIPHPTDPEYG
jgi:hypothetical protein